MTFGVADPVGAIGIQADLAAFAAMGCHGLSVVTALAVGDTTGVEDLQFVEPEWIADQARVLLEDMPVTAFKIGYLGNVESVAVIAEIMSDYPEVPLVLDPFSTALSEQENDDELLLAIRQLLVPQSTLLLVSTDELSRMAETWREPSTSDLLSIDAMHTLQLGCEFVFVTGTPGESGKVSNTLFGGEGLIRADSWPRLFGSFTGAGTTLSATIAAMLANGLEAPEAVFEAQEFTVAALTHAQRLGMGKLVPDRFFWAREPENGDA